MFGKLENEAIEALLHRQFVGRIGCHDEGMTYVVPISYAYDGNSVYGRTFEGMKLRMMRKNPSICFEVDDTRNLSEWQSVIAWGEFEELDRGPEREQAIRELEKRMLPILHSETMQVSSQWPFPSASSDIIDGVLFRIRLTEKTGRFEKSSGGYFFAT